jgi:hypothetical protein
MDKENPKIYGWWATFWVKTLILFSCFGVKTHFFNIFFLEFIRGIEKRMCLDVVEI